MMYTALSAIMVTSLDRAIIPLQSGWIKYGAEVMK